MTTAYDELIQLPDSYGIKDIVRKWQRLSENIARYPSDAQIILPDLLITARYGVGKTHILRLLSEYLSSRPNLMEFYGNVRFFEFYLNYCKPDDTFTEISRLMVEIEEAAGFRSEYKGMICIDINEWVSHCEEKHFMDLLEYLSVNSDHWLIVFSVSDGSRPGIDKLAAVLSMFLRLEVLTLALPGTDELLRYVDKKLMQYNLMLDPGAASLLGDTIKELSRNKYFDGYKTLDMLVCDITYSIYTGSDQPKITLSADDLACFSANGAYVQRRLILFENKKRYIGFIQGDA